MHNYTIDWSYIFQPELIFWIIGIFIIYTVARYLEKRLFKIEETHNLTYNPGFRIASILIRIIVWIVGIFILWWVGMVVSDFYISF